MKNKKRDNYINTKLNDDLKFLNDNKNIKAIVCGEKFTTFTDMDSDINMKKSFEKAKEKFEKDNNHKPYSRYRIFAVAKLELIEALKQYIDFSFDIIFIEQMELNPYLNVIELEVFILDDNPKMKECMELLSQMDYVVPCCTTNFYIMTRQQSAIYV